MLTIYKASAGSGKTYTLAYEYVRLLVGIKTEAGKYLLNDKKYLGGYILPSRHRHILAITFTNKATEEMKSRIIKELGLLAADHSDGSEDCQYAPGLIKEFGCTRDELQAVADRALKELLFDYHHFNVSTIDSFFQTVLRAFAREVDRQGDYGIELSDEYAVKAGIGLMLDDLNYGNPPHRKQILDWIRNYSVQLVEEGKDGSVFNRNGTLIKGLAEYVGKMGSEIFKRKADEVLKYLDERGKMQQFISEINQRINTIRTDIKERINIQISELRSLCYDDAVLPSTVWKIFTAMLNDQKLDIEDAYDKVGIIKILNWYQTLDTSFYVKSKIPGKTKIFPPNTFSGSLCELLCDIREAYTEISVLQLIINSCPNLEFLGFAWHYINRFREENNLILLSDTHDLLERIIAGSDTPFIYEKTGVSLQHFLIDEFQDTSHMQWHNLKPLVANSLSTDCDNLIIGDEKQAIYRFRNSDSSLLHHVVANEDFPDNHIIRGNIPAENTNYRSAAGIVMFNNAMFSRLSKLLGVEGYENTVQGISSGKKDLSSYINIYNTSILGTINDMPAEFDITAREILRQHQAGYRWSDIAILVRQRSEAEAIVNYLLKNYPEINILSDEALLLRNSPAVKLIVSMLKLIDKSYSALNDNNSSDSDGSPMYASAGDIRMMISRYEYFTSSGYNSAEALKLALQPTAQAEGQTIASSIYDIRAAHPSGLVSLVETIIANKISESRRKKEFAYIAAFQDEVIKYCSTYNPSIHAFLDWWNEASQRLAINSGADQDAVSVMTIHKSKGLQWACVHIPFGDWRLIRPVDNVWITLDSLEYIPDEIKPPLLSVALNNTCLNDGSPLIDVACQNRHEQLVDNLNATYVAYTRPERELNICMSSFKEVGKSIVTVIEQPPFDEDSELCLDLESYVQTPDAECEPGLLFRFGEPTTPKDNHETKATTDQQSISDYRVCFRADTKALTSIDDAISDLGDIMSDEIAESTDSNKKVNYSDARFIAAERGTLLHNIMADIEHLDDITHAISRAAQRLDLSEEDSQTYHQLITQAFEQAKEHTLRWFATDCRILKEQSIYLPEGDMTLRPDRIVFLPDGSVEIVDYKFTSEPLESHNHQVEDYIRLINAMGYERVTAYLWYPELNIVKQVKL